jgi:hypothetical protein
MICGWLLVWLDQTMTLSHICMASESVTISGIPFQDGGSFLCGGNLGSEANRDHLIQDCTFDGGQGTSLSNVFIQTFGTLTIRQSSFTNGTIDAVGLDVKDATRVVIIEDCPFHTGISAFMTCRPWDRTMY